MIIAFDLSLLNTGVAVFDDAGNCIKLLSIDTKKDEGHPKKLKTLEKQLMSLKRKYKPSLIVMEQSFTRFNASTQAIFKVRGVVELIFYNVEQISYHATSIRKEVIGKGNAKKPEVQEYILKNYPDIKFDDFDQSDAFAVGLCYFKKVGRNG